MRAAYVKAPFQFQIRDVDLRAIQDDEVLVDVRACGVCGSDLESARAAAAEWRPFGHEVAGVVSAAGRQVSHVQAGQKIVLAGSTFDRYSRPSLDGRVDLDDGGPTFGTEGPMGFSELMIAPREAVVPFEGISFTAAALVEPLSVALDLVGAADIDVGDDVLVIGAGSIGLMAVRLARARGARKIYAAQRSGARRRMELAREMGADEVIPVDEVRLADFSYAAGGVDRVLVTAPPQTIPEAVAVTAVGGILAFVGSGPESSVTLDADTFRAHRLQLRASRASPALRFPTCIDLIREGVVNAEKLVSHTFQIDEIPQAFRIMRDDRQNRVKLVMVKD